MSKLQRARRKLRRLHHRYPRSPRTEAIRRRIVKLVAHIRYLRAHPLSAVSVHARGGRAHWGGGNDIVRQFVTPFMARRGLLAGSGKRGPRHNADIGGSPTSDHLTTYPLRMAKDYPTFDGETIARALAEALGIHNWAPDSYTTYVIKVDGHLFRTQILWGAAIDHADHIHVGLELTS